MIAQPTCLRRHAFPGVLLVFTLAAGLPALAAQEGLTADIEITSADNQPMQMTVSVEGMAARMDMSSPEGEVSTVFTESGMLMIMHSRQMYMEFTKEMMERMGQMMGGMGAQAQAEVEEFDPTSVSFERTGNTETINGHEAFEVAMHSADEAISYVWLTDDLEVGLFEVFARMSEPLSSINMPFMGGGDSPTQRLKEYEQYARAAGLPDGKVIRLVTEDGGHVTVGNVVAGPIDPTLWTAPEGYQKQAMPGMPRQ